MSVLNLQLGYNELSPARLGYLWEFQIFDVLRDYLQSDQSPETEAMAALINNMIPDESEYQDCPPDIRLAGIIYEICQQIPYQHVAQVKLVRLIELLSLCPKLNKKQDIEEKEIKVYESWPALRTELDMWRYLHLEESNNAIKFTEYINSNALIARLTAENFLEDIDYGVGALRDALEKDIGGEKLRNCLVTTAALFILYAGQNLFLHTVSVPKPNPGLNYEPGPLFQGGTYCLERWTFWKRAFAAAAGWKDANEECQRLALKAVDMMSSLERNMSL